MSFGRVSGLRCGGSVKPFNGNIKEIRGRLGMSQEELAHEVGVSLSTIQRWEKNSTQPSRLALRELERMLRGAGIADRLPGG
jgi:putative transcriptional regulator